MCTVSIIPVNDTIVFTFNRDENIKRQTPEYFVQKRTEHKTIYFAKDTLAGGSWFTADEYGNVAVLFNGALKKHVKKMDYLKSRGLILLEIIANPNPILFFKDYDLEQIEAFSIILFFDSILYRLLWDGSIKTTIMLDKNEKHLFSSATLYGEHIQQRRKEWLSNFAQNSVLTPDTIFQFHLTNHINDKENGFLIQRENGIHTLSISQMVISSSTIDIVHLDVKTNKSIKKKITRNKEPVLYETNNIG
jgi:hypothetical protein